MISLHDGQITDLLNNSMRYNPETISIGYAILKEKQRLMGLEVRTRLMSMIDTVDEKILDYLAVELRTPAYKDTYPIEIKRRLIAGTLPFYAKLGTPSAVEWIIQSIFGKGWIEEWFEYGGNPHHFRILISGDHAIATLEGFDELLRAIYVVKRLSSWLDEIIIIINMPPSTLYEGGSGGIFSSIGIPRGADTFDEQTFLYEGGSFSGQVVLPVPNDVTPPPSTTILRTGGVCTIISNRGV